MEIPPIPPWDAMHPLIIHFPIVLLLLVPLFIAISSVLRPRKDSPYLLTALILLLLGTASIFVASSTGKEAAELADRSPAINTTLMMHQHLASRTEFLFTILSFLFIAIVVFTRARSLPETRLITTVLPTAYLCLYFMGVIYLINTAHAGGRLVHEFGVHAVLSETSGSEESAPMASEPQLKRGE